MGVCTAFVFAALVEFTFVNYMWRSPSISEGKRKNYAERHLMEKRRHLHAGRKSNPNSSFFPCLDRQDSTIELNMVIMKFSDCLNILNQLKVKSCQINDRSKLP